MIYKCKYFKLQELVCRHTYEQYGERCWEFFDEEILKTLDAVREILNAPITINNWSSGGTYNESGFRCPKCSLISKELKKDKLNMSAHSTFTGFDLKVKGKTPKESCDILLKNKDKIPKLKRIENTDFTKTWLHIDFRGHHKGIKIFNP